MELWTVGLLTGEQHHRHREEAAQDPRHAVQVVDAAGVVDAQLPPQFAAQHSVAQRADEARQAAGRHCPGWLEDHVGRGPHYHPARETRVLHVLGRELPRRGEDWRLSGLQLCLNGGESWESLEPRLPAPQDAGHHEGGDRGRHQTEIRVDDGSVPGSS